MSALENIQKQLQASKRSFSNLTGSIITRTKSVSNSAMQSPVSPTSLLRKATPSINRANKTLSPIAEGLGSTALDFSVRPFTRLVARATVSATGQKEYVPGKKTRPLSGAAEELLIGKDRITSFKEGNRVLTKDLEKYISPGKAKIAAPLLIGAGTLMDAVPFGVDDFLKQGGKKVGSEAIMSLVDDVSESALSKYASKIGKRVERKSSVRKGLDSAYTMWVNAWHPVESYADKIQKASGVNIPVEKSVKYNIKKYLGSGGIAKLRHEKELKPILAEVQDIPRDLFEGYLMAKRDLGFEEAGRKIKGVDPDLARRAITEMHEMLGVDRVKQLDETINKLYAYQDAGLQKLRDTGFIDDATYEAIKNRNIDYVPYKRVMDKVDEILGISNSVQVSTKPGMLKEIKGSDRLIQSPLESIIADTYKIEALVAKNDFVNSFVKLKDYFDDGTIKALKGKTFDKNTISVWRNGVKEIYQVEPEIEAVIKGLDQESLDIVSRLAGDITGIFRQAQTGRNIDFMIPNIVKDQFDAAVNAKYGYIPFVDYIRGLGHLINYDFRGGDKLVEDWLRAGGDQVYRRVASKASVGEGISEATGSGGMRGVKDSVVKVLDFLGRYSETPTRLGVAGKAYKATGNIAEAVLESREATVDFARMGTKMRVANAFIPFLNPSVQGFDKMLRTLKSNPRKFAFALAAYGGLPATLASLYNNAFHGREYAEVPDWEKENNFIIMTGETINGKPWYLKIAKGNTIPYVANPADYFITYLYKNDQQSFQSLLTSMLTGALPVIGDGSNASDVGSRTLGNIIPQPIKPLVEAKSNFDLFKNKPIESISMQFKEPKNRSKAGTPWLYKSIGKALDMSPLKVEKILEGYLAGASKTPADILEVISQIKEGEDIDVNIIPVLRRFIGNYEDFEDTPKSTPAKGLRVKKLKPGVKLNPSNGL